MARYLGKNQTYGFSSLYITFSAGARVINQRLQILSDFYAGHNLTVWPSTHNLAMDNSTLSIVANGNIFNLFEEYYYVLALYTLVST